MLFASAAGEFDRSGIPKYGVDLSDDDDSFLLTDGPPLIPRDTLAYDPELDEESD